MSVFLASICTWDFSEDPFENGDPATSQSLAQDDATPVMLRAVAASTSTIRHLLHLDPASL